MLRALVLALGLGVGLPHGARAEPARQPDGLTLLFFVADTRADLALLLRAPISLRCPVVRYRVEGNGKASISAALGPGEVQILRLRSRPPTAGQMALRVTPVGCAAPPVLARRVILGRKSNDHSWRAGTALADVEGHALGQWQRAPIVQRIGRPPHIGLPGV